MLEEVDHEEFDVLPLFDDTKYERSDIHDFYKNNGDEIIYVGKLYRNKEDCQIALVIFAINNHFHFMQTRTQASLCHELCICAMRLEDHGSQDGRYGVLCDQKGKS